MDVLDRYLNAVKSFLPSGQQEDLIAELRANLQAEMEDREAELGQPLTEAEQGTILKRHGHPMLVAGQYQSTQGGVVFGKKLIGATLFPLYCRVLSITLIVTFAIYLLVLGVLGVSGHAIPFGGALNAVLLQVIIQFAVVTAIFTVAEYSLPNMEWDVQRPPVLAPVWRPGQQRLRLEPITEIVACLIFLYWLWVVLARPARLVGFGTTTYQLGTIWYQVGWLVAILAVAYLVWAVTTLIRPEWGRFRPVVRVVADLAILGIAVYLLQAGHWIVPTPTAGQTGDTLATINQYMQLCLLPVTIGVVIVTLIDSWRLLKPGRPRSA